MFEFVEHSNKYIFHILYETPLFLMQEVEVKVEPEDFVADEEISAPMNASINKPQAIITASNLNIGSP
jgi:hypothetical protein